MKKVYILSLILAFAFILPVEMYSSESESAAVTLKKKPKYKDLPTKGPRMPSAETVCIIDFTTGQITVQISSPVISYELWDEEGETSIAAHPSDSELVQFMTGLDGVYQLRLVTDEYIYIGYIEL